MSGLTWLLGAAVVALGTRAAPRADEAPLAEDVARVAQRRILFGHMSVGADLLGGIERLAAASGGALRVLEVRHPGPIPPGTLAHAYVGGNGTPRGKLDDFARRLDAAAAAPPDVALVKLCWADFGADTDAAALFDAYRAALSQLERRYPGTVFAHVTVPLTTVQGGPKAVLKQLLGRRPYGLVENARREAFNARLRATYGPGGRVFDLARLEATAPDGTPVTVELDGARVPALAEQYTDDGGHLRPDASERFGRSLLAFLATVR